MLWAEEHVSSRDALQYVRTCRKTAPHLQHSSKGSLWLCDDSSGTKGQTLTQWVMHYYPYVNSQCNLLMTATTPTWEVLGSKKSMAMGICSSGKKEDVFLALEVLSLFWPRNIQTCKSSASALLQSMYSTKMVLNCILISSFLLAKDRGKFVEIPLHLCSQPQSEIPLCTGQQYTLIRN